MSDAEPDLYSFLRSKGFSGADPEDDEDSTSEVRPVDAFDTEAGSDPETNDTFGYNFDDEGLGEALRSLSEEALDNAPFGIVEVDDKGIVQFYNEYESQLARVAPEVAVGRNFFTELAPCSGNRLFHGRFKDGMRKRALDERFSYTFTYKMSPTLVQIRMYRDEEGQNWVLIRKQ